MSLKRPISGAGFCAVARLQKPAKESRFRWIAEAGGRQAEGDTVEEACDNLQESLVKAGHRE